MRRSPLLTLTATTLLTLAASAAASAQTAAKPEAAGKPGTAIRREIVAAESGARIAPGLRKDILALLGLLNVVEIELKGVDPLFEQFKRAAPHVPARVWAELKAEILKEVTPEVILNTYMPIYARKFSHAEIRQLVRFYSSPVGKKLVALAPEMEAEEFLAGYERGVKIGERLRGRLKALGYDLSAT
jgi:hypothetical protein